MFTLVLGCVFAMGKPTVSHKEIDSYQVLAVPKAPESNAITLFSEEPKEGQTGLENPVILQFRIDGFPLGTGSPGERSKEIALSPEGQTVHIVVDNYPYLSVNKSSIDPFNEGGNFFDSSFQLKIPFDLGEGTHVVRMFPARAYGESLKSRNTYRVTTFTIGDKAGVLEQDLNGPYLTYNEPSDQLPLKESQPILLDFYISNCELTPKGYNILLTIDGDYKRHLSSWQPYYIYGLKAGKHTIRLELLGPDGNPIKGPFNDVERTIEVDS